MKLNLFLYLFFTGCLSQIKIYSQTAPILTHVKSKIIKINKQNYITISAFIEVPENRNNDSSRILKIPIFVIRSPKKQASEPVFFMEGGPGASNISDTKNIALLENHDFVSIGYRGADGSTILKSKKISKASKGLHNKLLSEESINNFRSEIDNYLIEIQKQGIDINQYTIMNVIEDFEYARKALGYTKINLLSISYGTRVALLYSYKYPEVIKRSIMVGANPPGHFIWWPEKTDEIINIYDSLYMVQKIVKYKGSIKQAMNKAFENMPKRWTCFKLDPDKIKVGIFLLMYQKNNSAMAFEAIFKASQKKDYSGLYAIQIAYDYFVPKTIWGDMLSKGYSADYDSKTNYKEKLSLYPNSALGVNYSMLLWGNVSQKLKQTIPEEYMRVRKSETETLILSGNLDNSTPADYAREELLPFLPNGKQIIMKDMSHADLIFGQLDNYRKTVAGYYDTGIANDSSFHYDPINFKPKRNINRLAKVFYPVVFFYSVFNN